MVITSSTQVLYSPCLLGKKLFSKPDKLACKQQTHSLKQNFAATTSSIDKRWVLLINLWINPVVCLYCFLMLTITYYKGDSKNKKYFQVTFWCISLSQIGVSCQYLEGPISTYKDSNTNIGVQKNKDIPTMVLSGTDWSFNVLTGVPY